MSDPVGPTKLFHDFLEGLIALDQEAKRPENRPPQYQDDPDGEWGVEFWQLQQYVVELAVELIQFQAQFDELQKEWVGHSEYWGRYLGTAAIQYARHLIEDPDFEDDEFAMDWFFFHMKEEGE